MDVLRLKHWMVIAIVIAGLTAIIPLLPETTATAILDIPLSIRALLAAAPSGGLHGTSTAIPVIFFASLINGALRGSVVRLTR
jgi:hypothetical protein